MVLEWFCPCGLSGVAVATKPAEQTMRVTLSHQHAETQRRRHEKWRQNRCNGKSIQFSERQKSNTKGAK